MTERPDDWGKFRHTEAHLAFAAGRDLLLELRTDLDAARKAFSWPRPETFNWALEWFDVIAEDNHRPALEMVRANGSVRSISYLELSARSDQLANWLTGLGVSRGDRVMVVLDQQSELWETILACLKLGAVVIPTYTSLTRAEAADRITRGRVRHLVTRSGLTALFDDLPLTNRIAVGPAVPGWLDHRASYQAPGPFLPDSPTGAADPAFAYFTSGTTSAPKLVLHTHVSYPIGHLSSMYFNGLMPGDRHLNVSAPGWAKHSWSSFFVPFSAEATLVVAEEDCAAPALLPRLLAEQRVTSLCAPPSYWTQLVEHLGSAAPRLREAASVGEPLPARVAEAVGAAWGVTLREGYGQTETTALIGTTPGMRSEPGWLGLPLPGWDMVVEDSVICVDLNSPALGMMAGYDGDPERTNRAISGGRYRTGDIGEIRADGYIRVLGRSDDVFKSGGHRVSPYELEAVLRSHAEVRDAAVVPTAHPTLGKAAHAVVEVVHGATVTAADLLRYVDARVSSALRVHTLEFTERLPRTVSGKVRRASLTG
ncbi:AMP-binding protein [Streptacidiphilus sp. P02-A3a]|uniref:AMP-binding protein n=1 Tax=Streptacidiphilus sp. P02-A3a TaxID=2704468 RepID=UPI0015F92907|nr:AMP-binding protein [Streptacidiphilus sp. P02-A3a]QMU68230.1 AMP-binding protein [Streptacidiphilus sp. P02-A3a]